MTRHALTLTLVLLTSLLAACGGGGTSGNGSGGGGGTPQDTPTLAAIAPSSTTAGASAVSLVLYGSNFENSATVLWNGAALSSSWVSATEMTATIPATDVTSVGNAKVTVANPSPGGGTSAAATFTIAAAPAATNWVRAVAGVATPQDVVWDAAHGKLYASIASTDTVVPNTIVAVNPVTATAGTPVAAGSDPNLLSISSDSSYLWVGLDGSHAVQRFLLPGLTKNISFSLAPDQYGNQQQPVGLQAAVVNPHTVAVISGFWEGSPGDPGFGEGEAVYVYDDATPRPTSLPGILPGGVAIDWVQWGRNDSTMYTTGEIGGVATLNVTPAGVSLGSSNGGNAGPAYVGQYDANNGLLYSFGGAYDPVNGAQVGSFSVAVGSFVCTADPSLGRYYCFVEYQTDGTDVSLFELWVFDLNTYALLNRVYFGVSAGVPLSPITGNPTHLVRWGNAGLALTTSTYPYVGNGGLFLIDGAAVNPNAAPDASTGTPENLYAFMTSFSPQQAPVGSGDVSVTLTGNNFTQDSTACWNCNYLQFQFLPTTYVSSQQLTVTIPANMTATPGPLPISVFDADSNLFSSNQLTFTMISPPASGSTTQLTAMNLDGLAMASDAASGLLYVATADYDSAYPNSIVVMSGENGSIAQTQIVASDPYLLSISANGQYLYTGFASTTTVTQLQLPSLGSPLTWPLYNSMSSATYWASDLKAAPTSPHTTAVNLINVGSQPEETGGVVVYDDNVLRPDFVLGWGETTNIFDTLAWGSSDEFLTAAAFGVPAGTPLFEFLVGPSGAVSQASGKPFNYGEIHSDFATGLIYSDDGNVAEVTTQIVGTYNASGLAAPDSSLNRVFILGQTAAQANTNSFTIQSFDQKAYTLVSSITIDDLLGSPIQLVRWGASGLAVLTVNDGGGSPGMLYLIHDTTFVSSAAKASASPKPQELVQRRWKPVSKRDILKMVQARKAKLP